MNRDEKLIETLIAATENGKANWRKEDWINIEYLIKTYGEAEGLVILVGQAKHVFLKKYGSVEERVDLLLFNNKGTPALVIEEMDIQEGHRLWTLYKLAERNASGADKMIDEIISELSDDL